MINDISANKYINVLECNQKYKKMSNEEINKLCNGCGSGWNVDLVPDKILIDFSICCNIHDLDYSFAKDRKKSDKRLKNNMERLAEHIYIKETKKLTWFKLSNWDDILKARAKRRAIYILANIYYKFVHEFGQSAWNKGHKI